MFFIACKLVSITTGFLYPAYSSYKAIRNNDAQAIEHWLMYAVVLSVVHAAESTVEWTVNWIPFYYELKSIVIIWLTLPQIQGSTFVYLTYVDPFLTSHEAEIDKTIASSKEKARAAGLDYMRRAWEAFRETVIRAIMSPDDAQAGAALAAGASRTTNTTANANANAIAESSAPVQPQPQLSAASQGAYAFAGNVLRTYGPAAMAILKPLSPPRAGVGAGAGTRSGPASRGKKDDDLFNESAAGRYPADLGNRRAQPGLLSQQDTEAQRRVASASAALVGAVTSTAHATANKYAGLSRQQLRQRRLELERELAALDSPGLDARNASLATSASASASASPGPAARRTPSPIPESLRPGPSSPFSFFGHSAGTSGSGVGQTGNSRDRHTSAPTPARSAGPSPGAGSSLYPPLDASTTFAFDAIARDEINDSEFPPDWGRNARSQGWRGAPPAPSEQQQSRGTRLSDSADRPPLQQQHQQKRGSWFGWGGSSQPATQPVPSGAAKKNA